MHDLDVDVEGSLVLAGSFYGSADFGGGTLFSPSGTYELFGLKLGADGEHVWSGAYGGSDSGAFERPPVVLALTPDDRVVFAGKMVSSLDFGAGELTKKFGVRAFVAELREPDGRLRFGQEHAPLPARRPR